MSAPLDRTASNATGRRASADGRRMMWARYGVRGIVVLVLIVMLAAYAWQAPRAAGCVAGAGWAADSRARFDAVLSRAAVLDPLLGPTPEARAFAADLQRAAKAQRASAPAQIGRAHV